MKKAAPDERIQYIRTLFAPEDSLLKDIVKRLIDADIAIQVGAEEGKILQFLVQLSQTKTIVEIGTLAGYSTLWLARALPKDGHVYTIEKEAECIPLAEDTFRRSDVAERITLLKGSAQKHLPQLAAKGPFDMLFIDADKISYLDYLDWGERNIRKGGLIVADNTFLFGTVYKDAIPEGVDIRETAHRVMKEFNRRLADPSRYLGIMLPTHEGMTIGLKLF